MGGTVCMDVGSSAVIKSVTERQVPKTVDRSRRRLEGALPFRKIPNLAIRQCWHQVAKTDRYAKAGHQAETDRVEVPCSVRPSKQRVHVSAQSKLLAIGRILAS